MQSTAHILFFCIYTSTIIIIWKERDIERMEELKEGNSTTYQASKVVAVVQVSRYSSQYSPWLELGLIIFHTLLYIKWYGSRVTGYNII